MLEKRPKKTGKELETFKADVAKLRPEMLRFANSLTKDSTAAEDIVSTATERALTNADYSNELGTLQSYLFKIIQNRWIDIYGRGTALIPLDTEEALEIADPTVNADTSLEFKQGLALIIENISKLPSDQQTVLKAYLKGNLDPEKYDGVASYQEIADELNIPLGTVMSRLSRARKTLREILAEKEE